MGDRSGKGQGQEDYGFIVLYLAGKVIPKPGEDFPEAPGIGEQACLFPTCPNCLPGMCKESNTNQLTINKKTGINIHGGNDNGG